MPGNDESGFKPMTALVDSVKRENDQISTIKMFFPHRDDRAKFDFYPGQFAMFSIPGIGEAPLSMCSPPGNRDSLEISVRDVGNVTHALTNLKQGDMIGVRGPYGNGYPVSDLKGKDLVLVAGGIGFPPLASVVEHVIANRAEYGKLWVLYGVKELDDMIYGERMKRWAKAKDVEVLVTVETPCNKWNGCVGVVTKLFDKLDIDPRRTVGLSCGPPIMLKFVTLGLQKLGIKDEDIHISLERMMQCGIGKCGHCNIGGKYVCTDGPVFSYSVVRGMVEKVW